VGLATAKKNKEEEEDGSELHQLACLGAQAGGG